MRKAFMFVFLVICCPWANGESQTPADPFGLSNFGFERKLESRPLVTPSSEPEQARACGTGVYLREETISVNNKPKKSKVVIVYFLPNPSTLSAFGDQLSKLELSGTIPCADDNELAGRIFIVNVFLAAQAKSRSVGPFHENGKSKWGLGADYNEFPGPT